MTTRRAAGLSRTPAVAGERGRDAPGGAGLVRRFLAARPWARRAGAFLAGLAGTLALPPFDLLPFLFVAFTGLLLVLDGAVDPDAPAGRRAAAGAAVGWLFGFGYFLGGLWWVGAAFLVEAERFAALMPFAVAGLPAGLGLFPALGCAGAALLFGRVPARLLALAAALAASEWLRGTVLTGFPWNAYGLMLSASPLLVQGASLVGQAGLTFLAVLAGAAPATLLSPGTRAARLGPSVLAAALLAALALYGAARLAGGAPPADPAFPVRIVQPAVPQDEKWLAEKADAIFSDLLAFSAGEDGVPPGTLVVWPETALPFLYEGNLSAEVAVDALLPPGTELITGAVRLGRPEGPGPRPILNGLLLLDDTGAVAARYDKLRLVPFGEYLPLRGVLSALGLRKLTTGLQDFSPGTRPGPITDERGRRLAPSICYEIVFPGAIPGVGPDRARAIVNVTNDAWFGDTPGPYQHLRQARLRAVETGLPVVRAANNGISAIIGPRGEVVARLPLDARGALDGTVPAPVDPPPYARLGDAPLAVVILLCAVAAGLARRRRRKL